MLDVLYRGHHNSYMDLEDAALTLQNWSAGRVNDTLDAYTKNGTLGGSVAGLKGPKLAGAALGGTARPLGWFVRDAVHGEFESNGYEASKKAVFISVPGSMFKIDVYETHDEAGTTPLVYAEGDILYASNWGLATKEAPGGNNVYDLEIGVVVDVPTADSPYLTVMSLI